MKSVFLVLSVAIIGGFMAGCAKEPYKVVFERGEEAARQGDFAAAASNFRKATKADPNSMMAFYYLGQAELARDKFGSAASAFQRASTLSTNNFVNALEGLGRARLMQKRFDEANTAYERAIQISGRTPRLLAARAGVDMRRGQTELARTLLKEALQLNPDEPVALYNMAYIQRHVFSEKDLPASVRYYQQFLKFAPQTDIRARQKAEKALTEMADIQPATSIRAETLLMQSRQAGSKAESIQLAEEAVKEDPLSADVLWNLATLLTEEGRDSARITRTYAKFAVMFPEDSRRNRIPKNFTITDGSSDQGKARALAEAGKWKEAIDIATKAKSADAWMELCGVAWKASNWNQVEFTAKKVLELKKDHPPAMYQLGVALIEKGQKRQGGDHIRKYLKTLPDGSPKKKEIEDWLRRKGA